MTDGGRKKLRQMIGVTRGPALGKGVRERKSKVHAEGVGAGDVMIE